MKYAEAMEKRYFALHTHTQSLSDTFWDQLPRDAKW